MGELNKQQVDVLAAALAQVMLDPDKYKADKSYPLFQGTKGVTGTPDAVYSHGPGGIFSTPGIENVVINAHITPRDLDALLPVYPTVYTNPLYPSLTGFSEDDGNEPSGECDNCLGGTMQGCLLTAAFGRVCRESDEINIARTMQMINRGETTPLTVLGDVLGPGGISAMPSTPGAWIEVVTRAEMVKIAILIQRWLVRTTWQGNPINNIGTGYLEFPGLEMLVGTGKMDAITGVACPALDSDVKQFGYTDVGGQVAGNNIVVYLSMLEWYVRHVSERVGMDPATWVFAMRPELWFELTAIWPCSYLTDRCGTTAGQYSWVQDPGGTWHMVGGTANIMNDRTNTDMRDMLRESKTLIVNGRTYPVVMCDGMTEEQGGDPGLPNWNGNLVPGQFASDIFFLPLSVRGGMNVLYWEHMDFSKATAEIALSKSGNDFWTDGGRFFWTAERQMWCYVMAAQIMPRIILRTPHIAGRLDNVAYTPLQHLRSPFANDPYFLKGGVHDRDNPADSYYSEWNPYGPYRDQ